VLGSRYWVPGREKERAGEYRALNINELNCEAFG